MKTEPYEGRTKADFKALRERIGLKQTEAASELGVNLVTFKRWERPGYMEPPADAWRLLDGYLDAQKDAVNAALDQVAEVIEKMGRPPHEVVMTYFRDQAQYNDAGRDAGLYGVVNARSRAVADALERKGVKVTFRYPDDGAVRTEGSRY